MKRILIIEDDKDIAAIERDYLAAFSYEVEIAADGTEGLRMGLENRFDLILLDLMLPGMDGFAVCRKLREHLDIPILMVTARREDIDKIRGLGLGADDYIDKPFSPSSGQSPAYFGDPARGDPAEYRHAPGLCAGSGGVPEEPGVRAPFVHDAPCRYSLQPGSAL